MKNSARSERWRTGHDARAWRGASEAGVAGVATGSGQAEAYGDRETLPAARAGGPGPRRWRRRRQGLRLWGRWAASGKPPPCEC
jgi:hypothetical protein